MNLIIPFSEIPEHGVQLEIHDLSWFPEHFLEGAGPVAAHILLTKKQENKIELQGKLQADIRLSCDRCLQEYRYNLVSEMQLIVELPENERHWRLQDMDVSISELDTIQVEEPVVDLGDILRQQIFLNIPEKQLCRDDCLGFCKHCGINLNEQQCNCEDKIANSPFAVLASIKKQLKH